MSPNGRPLPHSLEAERGVLGAMLLSDSVHHAYIVETGLTVDHFYSGPHRLIYESMVDLNATGQAIDVLTVTEHLRARGKLDDAGGHTNVDALTADVPAVGNLRSYAAIVLDHAHRRREVELADQWRRAAESGQNAEQARQAVAVELASPRTGATSTTWAPIDLAEIVAGGRLGEPPELLERADGITLLYRGKVHALSGEPEAGKGWLALLATAERLHHGEHVLYVDFEDTAETIVGRLLTLSVPGELILERLRYVRPDEPLEGPGRAALDKALAAQPTLAIVDGVTEALAIHGLDLADNGDVARWLTLLPRPLAATGAAVVLIDHVVKDKEARGRYAIGAQHKLAGVDVAYTLEAIDPFGRGRSGRSKLSVRKDRPGYVRQHSDAAQRIAELRLDATTDATVNATLTAPTDTATEAPFRPTTLMERVSAAIEADPGLSTRALRTTVNGKNDYKDLALELLVAEGYVRREQDGQATRHHSIKPFTEASDAHRAPVPQPCPDRAPGTVERNRAPVPPPIRARGTGHAPAGHDHTAPATGHTPDALDLLTAHEVTA